MPLIIDDIKYTSEEGVQAAADAIFNHEKFKESSSSMCGSPVQEVSPKGLLYVNQREYAVVHPSDSFLKVLGTEDATTCHILIIRHTGSGVVCLSHCDGAGLEEGIAEMVKTVKSMSTGGPEGRLDLHLYGGFLDDRQESLKITKQLLKIFLESEEVLNLQTACILSHNDTIENDVHFPVIYGLAVDVKSGDMFRARFPDRGPLMDVRGATHFIGFDKMLNIYEADKGIMKIGPFTWSPWENIKDWLNVPDFFIRKYMSTSPEQEPQNFEENVRAALRVIHRHPNPEETLFVNGLALRHKLQPDGRWTPMPS